jgi:hypothetical protein
VSEQKSGSAIVVGEERGLAVEHLQKGYFRRAAHDRFRFPLSNCTGRLKGNATAMLTIYLALSLSHFGCSPFPICFAGETMMLWQERQAAEQEEEKASAVEQAQMFSPYQAEMLERLAQQRKNLIAGEAADRFNTPQRLAGLKPKNGASIASGKIRSASVRMMIDY